MLALPEPVVYTSRLILREAFAHDVNALHEIFSNDDVMRYWSHPPHTLLSQSSTWLNRMISSPGNGVRDFVFAKSESPGIIIGKVGLWQEKVQSEMEIGIMLNRDEWGKGYATEALDAFLDYYWGIKEAESVVAITADVDPRNRGCLKVLMGADFLISGYEKETFETHMGWCDSVYLKLQRPDGMDAGY